MFGLHTIEHALTPIVDKDLTLAIENMSRVNMASRPDDVPRRVLGTILLDLREETNEVLKYVLPNWFILKGLEGGQLGPIT